MNQIEEKVILSGTWLYGGTENNEVHIIKTNYKPGSSDYEDEPEVRDDQFGIFYGIQFGAYSREKNFMGGVYSSVKEAKEYAATVCPALNWSSHEESA